MTKAMLEVHLDITSGTITLQDIHFDNNSSGTDDGGAIYIGSGTTVTVDRCKFTNNTTTGSYDYGGAIGSEGSLTRENHTVATSPAYLYGNSEAAQVTTGIVHFANRNFNNNELYFC